MRKDASRRPASLSRVADETGSFLIEVVVGAVVVLIATLAVLNGIDTSRKANADSRSRSVAATLAEEDQERIRAMNVSTIIDYSESRVVNVEGRNYDVTTRTDPVSDSNGVISCTNSAASSNYLRVTSTVREQKLGRRAVVQTSLINPPPGTFPGDLGTIAIKAVDRAEQPQKDVLVKLDASGYTDSQYTNELGCAVFSFLPNRDYTATLSKGTLVGVDGLTPRVVDAKWTLNKTEVTQVPMDTGANVTATFQTDSTTVSTQHPISISNADLAAPLTYGDNTSVRSNYTFPTTGTLPYVFPFSDGASYYSGGCGYNNPANYDPNYFATAPGNRAFATPGPGGTASVQVQNPAIRVTVRYYVSSTSQPLLNNARVFVYTKGDAECTTVFPVRTTNGSGVLPRNGYPFGRYRVCADDNKTDGTGRFTITASGSANYIQNTRATGATTANGSTGFTLILGQAQTMSTTTGATPAVTTTTGTGTCPATA